VEIAARTTIALIRNAVTVVVYARSVCDVATVFDAVAVAVGFTLVGDAVRFAIRASSGGDVAFIRDAVAVAILAGPIG
jgi:hypothetical protein